MRPALIAVLLALVATACTAPTDEGAGAGAPTDEGAGAAAGGSGPGELVLAVGGESEEGYDPTLGWGRYGSPLFQSTLLRLDDDLELVNDLATGYEVSDEGLTWTVTIRDDAVFTDGEPVTAEDVAYTYETAATSGGVVDLTALDEAVVVDETTVELRLSAPQSTFANRLATLGIVPAHLHGDGYGRDPVGSGPFEFVRWDEGQQLIVERNDDYYGEKPAFERIVFQFTGDDASLAAARAGQVAIASVSQTLATTEVEGMTIREVESVDNRGVLFPTQPDEGQTDDDGNPIGNDVTADLAIRQAVNVAVDREALVDGILEGYGRPAAGPVDGLPWYEPDSAITGADPERAQEILADGGWEDTDGDGVVEKDGQPASFTIIYPADDTVRQGLAVATADMVTEIGIDADVDGRSFEEIEGLMHSQPVVFGWGSHDPTEMYNLYHSDFAGVEFFNAGYYVDEEVDDYLDLALAATSQEEANTFWKAAQLDEDGDGFTAPADAAWAWLVNLEHTYYVDDCLDLGTTQVEPHGHGFPVTAGITGWTWTC